MSEEKDLSASLLPADALASQSDTEALARTFHCVMCELVFGDDAVIRLVEGRLLCGDCYKDLPEPELSASLLPIDPSAAVNTEALPICECPPACCLDCGLPYEKFPLDLLFPRAQWLTIHPGENGLLCAQCMVTRAAKIPGATAVHAVVEIAPHQLSAAETRALLAGLHDIKHGRIKSLDEIDREIQTGSGNQATNDHSAATRRSEAPESSSSHSGGDRTERRS